MDTKGWIAQAEAIKQALVYCSYKPGATIRLEVTHDDGTIAAANLYDHAALVDGLYKALEYFQSEF